MDQEPGKLDYFPNQLRDLEQVTELIVSTPPTD